jgi:hypothetical protein
MYKYNAKATTQQNRPIPGAWPDDYRIPDLVLVTPSRYHINCNEFIGGGPDAVIETRSLLP